MASKSTSTAEKMLYEAVGADEAGNKEKAAEIYLELIESQPDFAPAYVNMGTLYFQQRHYAQAAEYYKRATEVQPNYSLAFFNYANVLEELGYYEESISAYLRSVQIDPKHRDSHYNLALAYQRKSESRKALRHWKAYVTLAGEKNDKWTKAAREEIKKLLALDPIQVAFTNAAPARTFDPRPMLSLVQ